MILEIALGIVLGFLLLALLPLILAGTITIVKWLAIGAIVVAVVAVLYTYPSQIIGTALVITASVLLVALWVVDFTRFNRHLLRSKLKWRVSHE